MGKKVKGNGEGTIYFSQTLNKWVAQYVEPSGKRKTLTQRKNEKVTDFKKRFTNIISSINNKTYIESIEISLYNILKDYIDTKYKTGITSPRTYKRNVESLKLLGIEDLKADEQYVVLDEIVKYVFDTNQKHSSKEKTFDFYYDYGYYFPDFIEKYGINLNKDDITWWEFDKLLDWCFRDKNSSLYNHMEFRMYKKPPKNKIHLIFIYYHIIIHNSKKKVYSF